MNIKNLAIALFCGWVLAGCGGDDDSPGAGKPLPDGTIFFLVSEFETEKGDSYILPLKDPDDIAAARHIIANRASEELDRLVVAKVEPATGNEEYANKDLVRDLTWSWKVTEFYGFAGATIEILDGGPQDVENDMEWWFDNTDSDEGRGTIGFWGYTVLREVDPDELKN